MKRKLALGACLALCLFAACFVAAGCLISQPGFSSRGPSAVKIAPEALRAHVTALSRTFYPRDYKHAANLDKCAAYIAAHFQSAGGRVEHQFFTAQGGRYENVIARFGAPGGSRLVIGAHYDAFEGTPGADDNASGVASLLEIAYLLGQGPVPREVELVAYCLEEPPFFETPFMGSAVHARRLSEQKAKVTGVIVLEMTGCFTDAKGSQSYPFPLLGLLYPGKGNFIAVAGRWDQGRWIKAVKAAMKGAAKVPVFSIRAPAAVRGVDFSDHRSYWPNGFRAAMVTDTAFYRNKTYHTADDTPNRLDYTRMAEVAVAVYEAARSL